MSDEKPVYAPEGYEVMEVTEDGSRSFYVTVRIGAPITARDEAQARQEFRDRYLKPGLVYPRGEFHTFELTVGRGPTMFRRKRA